MVLALEHPSRGQRQADGGHLQNGRARVGGEAWHVTGGLARRVCREMSFRRQSSWCAEFLKAEMPLNVVIGRWSGVKNLWQGRSLRIDLIGAP